MGASALAGHHLQQFCTTSGCSWAQDLSTLLFHLKSCLGLGLVLEKTLRSLSPMINLMLPSSLLNHVQKHICTSFKYFQGWCLHHLSVLMPDSSFDEEIFNNIQSKLSLQNLSPFCLVMSLISWEKRLPCYGFLSGNCREQ